MEIIEFVKKFAAQFDETDEEVFTPETVYVDLEEWSSLIALSIIAMIDEEYEVGVGAKEITSSVTIEGLFNVVKLKKGENV